MHKMGPRGPKQYIFGDHFYSKSARKKCLFLKRSDVFEKKLDF